MKTIIHHIEDIDADMIIEECTKKEITEIMLETLEYGCNEDSVAVLYKDGSFYSNICGDVDGKFRRNNIKAIILDNGCTTEVYGKYTVNECGIVDFVY
jgi:hypothetical protein